MTVYISINQIQNGYTGLHWSVRRDDEHMTRHLLNMNSNPNAKDNQKRTPLYFAVINSNFNLVKLLLYAGSRPKDHHFKYIEFATCKYIKKLLRRSSVVLIFQDLFNGSMDIAYVELPSETREDVFIRLKTPTADDFIAAHKTLSEDLTVSKISEGSLIVSYTRKVH